MDRARARFTMPCRETIALDPFTPVSRLPSLHFKFVYFRDNFSTTTMIPSFPSHRIINRARDRVFASNADTKCNDGSNFIVTLQINMNLFKMRAV